MVYTYDEIGNPTGDTLRSYTWEHGRQLESLTLMGNTWNYTYDANGMRTKRTNGSTTYEYVYSGDKLVQVIATDHTTTPETVSVVEYAYDAAGQPLTMTLGNDVYYYVLNIQGDVMGLVDSSGTLMITYYYEGYGECYSLSNTSDKAPLMSANNHLLYRGYVVDKGTGLYYLQSRYYDPNVGRFINADVYTSTGQGVLGSNMFAYCLNNPTTLVDPTGHCSYLGSIHAPKLDCGRYNCPDSASYCPDAIDITEELNSAMIKHSLELKSIADIYGPGAFMYFAIKSKKGSEWDLKNEGGWDLDETKVYRYGDQALREDDIGNIHYGFVGRTLTNLDTLLLAAGVVQIWDKSSDWSYWRTNFDEPRDQWAITIGYNLWEDGLRS